MREVGWKLGGWPGALIAPFSFVVVPAVMMVAASAAAAALPDIPAAMRMRPFYFLSITASRYSAGSAAVSSPERLKRAASSSRSAANRSCPAESSA